ncbi:hypothetical protein ABZ360_33845 [Streptomyces althioticus]
MPGRRARGTIEACPHEGWYRVRAHAPERTGRLSAPSRSPSAPFTRALVAAAADWYAYPETHADHCRLSFDDQGRLVRRRPAGPGSSRELLTEVVAEAGDGREDVELARAFRPDVALLDVRMPRLDGARAAGEAVRTVPARAPNTAARHGRWRAVRLPVAQAAW